MDLHARKRPLSFVQYAWKTCLFVSIYWLFSIAITFYQKRIINTHHFPFTIVLCHMILKYIFAISVQWVLNRFGFKSAGGYQQHAQITRTASNRGSDAGATSHPKSNVLQVALPASAGALDIGLSNWSYEFVNLTVYTITKSTSIVFILMFAVILRLEKLRPALAVTIVLIPTGLSLFLYRSEAFSLPGVTLLISAAALSGVRWSMSQMLMQHRGMSSPIEMMYRMLPWMIVTLVPFAAAIEGPKLINAWQASAADSHASWNFDTVMSLSALVVGGAVLAFCMEISEYLLLLYTSGLSLSISSVFKELLVMLLSYEINGDVMSTTNFLGACLCILGTVLYVVLKSLKVRQETAEAAVAAGVNTESSINAGSYSLVATTQSAATPDDDKIPLTDATKFRIDTDDDEDDEEENVMFHRR